MVGPDSHRQTLTREQCLDVLEHMMYFKGREDLGQVELAEQLIRIVSESIGGPVKVSNLETALYAIEKIYLS